MHVLHSKGIFFITKSVTLLKRGSFRVLSRPRYRPPAQLVVKKVKSEKWSESIFGPLNFFVFRYVEGGVLGNNYISIKKCRTTFLWEWYFGEVGEIFKNFQNHPLGEGFWKNGLQLHFLEINLQVISLEKKQSGNSLCFEKKITSDFPRKK